MTTLGRWAATIVTFVAMGGISPAIAARPATLSWEQAFPVGASRALHLDAHYVGSDGASHRLQLWRRGTAFLHRRTDGVLDLYLEKADGQSDYRYRMLDHRRRVSLAVNRGHLYRIGVFSDWFGLAHVVDRPKTRFTVHVTAPLAGERRRDCTWRLLVRETANGPERSRICWSSSFGVPLAIRSVGADGRWGDQFVADSVDDEAGVAESLTTPTTPEGYAFFDAGKEIAPEEGD